MTAIGLAGLSVAVLALVAGWEWKSYHGGWVEPRPKSGWG
jgi:hypothetical protein